jgi:hemerythrin-like domain-containing protein
MATQKSRRSNSNSRGRKRSARKASPASRRRPQRSRGQRSRPQDAIALLKGDHQEVKSLFQRFERSNSASEKERLAEKICNELKLHTRLEEELFYPEVRGAISDTDLVDEAEVEHASAKDLINQIEAASPADERYDALVKVLAEYVRHHIQEEEREMFPKVRRSELDLAAMGERLRERKREEQRAGTGGLGAMIFGRTGG